MLELREICFSKGKKKILDKILLHFHAGEFVAVTGANGSGKSTLARIIMGIEKPTSGKIFFKKEDITELSVFERARKGISLSFQTPVKFKGLTVFGLLKVAYSPTISEEKAREFLENVGLSPTKYLNRELDSSLSGGELKRIEIATVLAKNGAVLVFDEPEAGIDLWSFSDLAKIFKKLHKENKTLIVISHQEKILRLADRIVVLKDGKVIKNDKREKILTEILEDGNEF